MKAWFPFTSYDFYAYLTAGMLILAALDQAIPSGLLPAESEWTFVSGAFWAAVAYLIGHIIAMPSSALLEHTLARRLLHPPAEIILGLRNQRKREKLVQIVSGAREYAPLPEANRNAIRNCLARELAVDASSIEAESAFQTAFPVARKSSDTATRLDNFINLYGMARNVSLASLIASILLAIAAWYQRDQSLALLSGGAFILSLGLFLRFVKFYAAYTREVFRTYGHQTGGD